MVNCLHQCQCHLSIADITVTKLITKRHRLNALAMEAYVEIASNSDSVSLLTISTSFAKGPRHAVLTVIGHLQLAHMQPHANGFTSHDQLFTVKFSLDQVRECEGKMKQRSPHRRIHMLLWQL